MVIYGTRVGHDWKFALPKVVIYHCIVFERLVTSRAGALVWWLWEETHVLMVMDSNPSTAYWMDIFPHIFVVKL